MNMVSRTQDFEIDFGNHVVQEGPYGSGMLDDFTLYEKLQLKTFSDGLKCTRCRDVTRNGGFT